MKPIHFKKVFTAISYNSYLLFEVFMKLLLMDEVIDKIERFPTFHATGSRSYSNLEYSQSCIYTNISIHIGHLIVTDVIPIIFKNYKSVYFQKMLKVLVISSQIYNRPLTIYIETSQLSFEAGMIYLSISNDDNINLALANNREILCSNDESDDNMFNNSSYKKTYNQVMFPTLQRLFKRQLDRDIKDIDSITDHDIMLIQAAMI